MISQLPCSYPQTSVFGGKGALCLNSDFSNTMFHSKGHDFLAGIRDKETWAAKMKPVLDRFGSVSLSVIEALSKGAMDAFLDRVKIDKIFSQSQLPQ